MSTCTKTNGSVLEMNKFGGPSGTCDVKQQKNEVCPITWNVNQLRLSGSYLAGRKQETLGDERTA